MCRDRGKVDKVLGALLIIFDNYVLNEKEENIEFRGVVFEYKLECVVDSREQLIQKIGDFLITIPKYMWTLKQFPLSDFTVK